MILVYKQTFICDGWSQIFQSDCVGAFCVVKITFLTVGVEMKVMDIESVVGIDKGYPTT